MRRKKSANSRRGHKFPSQRQLRSSEGYVSPFGSEKSKIGPIHSAGSSTDAGNSNGTGGGGESVGNGIEVGIGRGSILAGGPNNTHNASMQGYGWGFGGQEQEGQGRWAINYGNYGMMEGVMRECVERDRVVGFTRETRKEKETVVTEKRDESDEWKEKRELAEEKGDGEKKEEGKNAGDERDDENKGAEMKVRGGLPVQHGREEAEEQDLVGAVLRNLNDSSVRSKKKRDVLKKGEEKLKRMLGIGSKD